MCQSSISNLDRQIAQLYQDRILPEAEIKLLCQKAIEIFSKESNVQPVSAPVTICGDILGQFNDLLELFKTGGQPPETNYLFLGDYIGYGYCSVECISLLFALKVRYPYRITLIRGFHESKNQSVRYCYSSSFYDESVRKYGNSNVWNYFTEVFDYLPLTALVEEKIFCVHSGLSPSLDTLDDIRKLDRIQDIPSEGPILDLIWFCRPDDDIETWRHVPKGSGFIFGSEITAQFNHTNGLNLIARGRQFLMKGYKQTHDNNLVTIYSAPNSYYELNNLAAIMEVDEHMKTTFLQFERAPQQDIDIIEKKRVPDYFL